MHARTPLTILALGAAAAGLASGVSGAATGDAAATRSIRVGDNYFVKRGGVPRTVTVSRNTKVVWRFVGDNPHNVHATRGPRRFRSKVKTSGRYSRTMKTRGTYTIICDVHGTPQRMRLVVR